MEGKIQQSTRQGKRNNTRIQAEGGVAGRVGGEGGERRERGGRGGRQRGRREGEEPRAFLRLLFIGNGDRGAAASSFLISPTWLDRVMN